MTYQVLQTGGTNRSYIPTEEIYKSSGVGPITGHGSPVGVVIGPAGLVYIDKDPPGTSYFKTSDIGAEGWL